MSLTYTKGNVFIPSVLGSLIQVALLFLAVPEWGPKQTEADFPIGEVLSYPEYVAFLRLFRIALALLFMNPTRVWIHLVKGLKWLETGDENIAGVVVVPWGLQLLLFEGLS